MITHAITHWTKVKGHFLKEVGMFVWKLWKLKTNKGKVFYKQVLYLVLSAIIFASKYLILNTEYFRLPMKGSKTGTKFSETTFLQAFLIFLEWKILFKSRIYWVIAQLMKNIHYKFYHNLFNANNYMKNFRILSIQAMVTGFESNSSHFF